ncbi:MAG: hypothetical protein SGPRY_007213 [Prymnesium sp.]
MQSQEPACSERSPDRWAVRSTRRSAASACKRLSEHAAPEASKRWLMHRALFRSQSSNFSTRSPSPSKKKRFAGLIGKIDHGKRPFVAFFLAAFVLVPIAILLIAFVFGACLASLEGWPIYDGFLYVMGNIVGLSTPLTQVTVEGHHVMSELFDLLVALWAVSIGASAIGFVGCLSLTSGIVSSLETRIQKRELRRAARHAKRTIGNQPLNRRQFLRAVEELNLPVTKHAVEKAFDELDADGKGLLDGPKLEAMIQRLAELNRPEEMHAQISQLANEVREHIARDEKAMASLHQQMSSICGQLGRLSMDLNQVALYEGEPSKSEC